MLEKEKKHHVFLGLGSNLGDRGHNLDDALSYIEGRIGDIVSTSAFYVTDPVGFMSENRFLNAVCKVCTVMLPLDILRITQDIEKQMGRIAKSINNNYTDRIIDIDLLLYDNDIIEYPDLILPHPALHKRLFVLLPLAEIAGSYIHPILNKSVSLLKSEIESEA